MGQNTNSVPARSTPMPPGKKRRCNCFKDCGFLSFLPLALRLIRHLVVTCYLHDMPHPLSFSCSILIIPPSFPSPLFPFTIISSQYQPLTTTPLTAKPSSRNVFQPARRRSILPQPQEKKNLQPMPPKISQQHQNLLPLRLKHPPSPYPTRL